MTDTRPLISAEIERFHAGARHLQSLLEVTQPCDDAYIIKANKSAGPSNRKPIDLTFMAITHGDEVGGISALADFLTEFAKSGFTGGSELTLNIAVVLGNREASLLGQRFVEKDLNRSFGGEDPQTQEEKRAHELARHILSKTQYLLDIHQTIEPTLQPFFIFPFSKPGYSWARQMHSDVAIVSHWGGTFSKEGMCTDAYVNQQGGTGLSLEIGQKGFDQRAHAFAVLQMLRAINTVDKNIHDSFQFEMPTNDQNLYTWAHTEPYPSGEVHLKKGLHNFQTVAKGDDLGTCGGQPILCAESGLLMFPKYHRQSHLRQPTELYRVLRKVTDTELVELIQ